MADSPAGPCQRIGQNLKQDWEVAIGAGRRSVIQIPGKEKHCIVYHRRPLGETDGKAPCYRHRPNEIWRPGPYQTGADPF